MLSVLVMAVCNVSIPLALFTLPELYLSERSLLCFYALDASKMRRIRVIIDKHDLVNARILDETPTHLARSAIDV